MAYTDIDDPSAYFQTTLYTGNGSNRDITGVGFQPNFTWIKQRNGTFSHVLGNSVSGDNKFLSSNGTGVESIDSDKFRTFVSDGFQVGTHNGVNGSSKTYVGWSWKAGTSFSNDASSTSVGSIDSVGSVSTTAGFSIISYTGNNTGGATIAHGLGVTPNVLIIKNRDDSNQAHWAVYHDKAFVSAADPNIVYLQDDAAQADDTNIRHSTATTNSTVFSIGDYNGVNGSGDAIIAFCFAEKQGYSKFGSYIGNGNADGPFIYTGFKPAWVMVKPTSRTGRWRIKDNKRDINNVMDKRLSAESSDAEGTGSTEYIDFLSNGFKARASEGQWNGSGEKNIYIAFAENPFVTSTGVPTTAR